MSNRSKAAQLLDHLVGADEQSGRHSKAERLGGLEIDEQLNFYRLLHRQIGWVVALENPTGVDTCLTVYVGDAASINSTAHQLR